MRRHLMTLVVALLLPGTLYAQGQKTTDFRGRDYSVEELEQALFPETESQVQMRGIAPLHASVTLPPPSPGVQAVIVPIFFEFNSDKLPSEYYADLEKIGQVLAQHPAQQIYIEGHTDSIGSDYYNQLLSQRRAESVKQYLVRYFPIAPEQLIVAGYGKSKPIRPNDTDEGRQMNRRVEFVRK